MKATAAVLDLLGIDPSGADDGTERGAR